MSNDYILSEIREFTDEYLKKLHRRLPRDLFKQVSYSRWAANEILKNVEESKLTPPTMIVEDFIRKMDDLSCMNNKTSSIFSVAHDMATDILDFLIAMSYRKEKKDESIKKTGSIHSGGR